MLSAVARLHSGLSGRTISRPSRVETLVQLQQESGTLSGKGMPGVTKLIVSTAFPARGFGTVAPAFLSLLGHSLQVRSMRRFHELTVNRFAELCELPCHQGAFDAPFTSSELRHALSRCTKSVIGAVALFPFQGDVSMVASSSVVFVQRCILVGHSAFVVESQNCGAHFSSMVTRRCRGTFAQSLWCHVV